jgi:hypothetical protein
LSNGIKKNHLTTTNNQNGLINNESRLTYILDKMTKLPIYFRTTDDNIINNYTFIPIFNLLMAYNAEVEVTIINAGYSSLKNLE